MRMPLMPNSMPGGSSTCIHAGAARSLGKLSSQAILHFRMPQDWQRKERLSQLPTSPPRSVQSLWLQPSTMPFTTCMHTPHHPRNLDTCPMPAPAVLHGAL